MKIQKTENGTKIFLSKNDSWRWAMRPGRSWPCSTLSDKRIYVELASNNDIIDVRINGRNPKNIDSHELRSLLKDILKND